MQLFELEHTTLVILPRQQRPVDWRETVLHEAKRPFRAQVADDGECHPGERVGVMPRIRV